MCVFFFLFSRGIQVPELELDMAELNASGDLEDLVNDTHNNADKLIQTSSKSTKEIAAILDRLSGLMRETAHQAGQYK